LAPEVSELPKPIPILAFIITVLLAFIVATTLPGEPEEEVPAEQQYVKGEPLMKDSL
jgi:hypothetical protein